MNIPVDRWGRNRENGRKSPSLSPPPILTSGQKRRKKRRKKIARFMMPKEPISRYGKVCIAAAFPVGEQPWRTINFPSGKVCVLGKFPRDMISFPFRRLRSISSAHRKTDRESVSLTVSPFSSRGTCPAPAPRATSRTRSSRGGGRTLRRELAEISFIAPGEGQKRPNGVDFAKMFNPL